VTSLIDLDGLLRRLHLPTVRRLYPELCVQAETEETSHRDFLATLIAEEVAHRAETRIQRSTRKARFPFLATIEDYNFAFQTSIRLTMLGSYLGPEFVTEGRCALFSGSTGLGKTHLAIAIAYRAIQNGFDALFTGANDMMDTLAQAGQEGRFREALSTYVAPSVLVIDEIGYLTHRPDAANVLFHVVNERHLRRRPIVMTTNKPEAAWGGVLHDADLAEAILDRVLERGRHFELRGPSYRTKRAERAGRAARALDEDGLTPGPATGGRARISGIPGPEFPEPTDLGGHPSLVGVVTCPQPQPELADEPPPMKLCFAPGSRTVTRAIISRRPTRWAVATGSRIDVRRLHVAVHRSSSPRVVR